METETALAQDRLEIVLRNEQDDLRYRKNLGKLDAVVGTVLGGSLLHNLLTGPSGVAVGSGSLLVLYVLIRVSATKNGRKRCVFRTVAFEENRIILSSREQTVEIPNNNIKHVHILNADTIHTSNDVAICILTKTGESHEFRLDLLRGIEDGLPYALLEKLKTAPYFTARIESLYPLLFLRYPEIQPLPQSALKERIGLIKLRTKIERNYEFDKVRLRLSNRQGILILFVFGALLMLAVTNVIPMVALMLPVAVFQAALPFAQKPLELILGAEGLAIGTNEQIAHAVSFSQLQSLRFTPSRIDADKGLIKTSITFLNGDELTYNIIVKKQEDKDALWQITQEFKELKHGT